MKKEVTANKGIFSFLMNTQKRKNFLLGGAGSGKSHAVAQHLILNKLFKEKDIRILVTRKALPSLKASCFQLVTDLLSSYGLPYQVNKTDLVISVGSNKMFFRSLDDPEKIKSTEINYVWGEEATELNAKEYLQLNLRTRRKNKNGANQLFFSFNPIDQNNYLHDIVELPKDDIAVHRSTFKDNAFVDKEYIAELLGLKKQDQTFYQIYTLGQWATPVNIIYSNYEIINRLPDHFDETIYGLDFGFNNPNALVRIGLKDKLVYIQEMLYESKMTNQDLLKRLESLIINKADYIYADTAEPARIEEIQRQGYNIHPSDKSVKDGIDNVKRNKLHITADSVNLYKELKSYKWKEDKDGNIIGDNPVPFNDHLVDAIRYALYTHHLKSASMPDIKLI